MDETIGYDSLFSPEEWDAIGRGDWNAIPPDPQLAAGVSAHVARVFGPPGQYEGNDARFEVECDACGDVGAGDTEEEAAAIALLHEVFGAVVAGPDGAVR